MQRLTGEMVRSSAFVFVSVAALSAALAAPAAAAASEGEAAFQGAEQVNPATPQASDVPPRDAVGDIVVTARRRDEKIQDVPVSVSVVSAAELDQANVSDIEGLTVVEPGLSLTVGTIFPYAFLRGFGTGGTNELEQSLGKFIDQVTYPRDQDIRLPLFDVARVEVLRGPQVLLYGNSATAGAINIVNQQPRSEFGAGLNASYEFLRQQPQIDAYINTPLSDSVAFRLAGYYQAVSDPETKNVYLNAGRPKSEVYALRPWLSFDLTPDLRIVLHGEYDNIDVDGGSLQFTAQPLDPTVVRYRIAGKGDEKFTPEGAPPFNTFDASALKGQLYQGDISYQSSVGTIQSTTAYRDSDSFSVLTLGPNLSPHFLTYTYQKYTQFTQEVRLNGSSHAVDWAAGAFYLNSRLKVGDASGVNLGALGRTGPIATPAGSYTFNNQKTESWSVFGDLTVRPVEGLSLEAGARYTKVSKTGGQNRAAGGPPTNLSFATGLDTIGQFENTALNGIVTAIFGGSLDDIPYGQLRVREDYLQPQFVVKYDINPDNMIYGKFVRGAKAGGWDFSFAGTNPADAVFRPEFAKMFEIGAKGELANGNLSYSLIGYREDFKDLQTAVFNENTLVLNNVGSARSEGIEASLIGRAAPGLTIGASLYYMKARYLDYRGAACNHIQNFQFGRNCRQDLTGAPTRFSSKWTGTVNVDYEGRVSPDWRIEAGAALYARSKYNAGDANDPDQVQDGYGQISAYLGLSPDDRKWKVSVFGRNLTDKRVLTFGGNTPLNGTATNSNFGPGREIGVRWEITVG